MQVRILGAHQGESRDMRFISMLVDGKLAIDAGGLTSSLTLAEQLALDAVLITHKHFDHIKDLPMLVHNLWQTKSVQLYCTADTLGALEKYLFNGEIWPQMRQDAPGYHSVETHEVVPDRKFEVAGYTVYPVSMVHTVPTVGYCVEGDGKRVFYTSDTRGDGDPHWAFLRPDVLIIETTMSTQADAVAGRFKHLTPLSLGAELRAFHKKEGYYPRTVCVHINPHHEAQVREELAALAEELGADITLGYEGLVVEV